MLKTISIALAKEEQHKNSKKLEKEKVKLTNDLKRRRKKIEEKILEVVKLTSLNEKLIKKNQDFQQMPKTLEKLNSKHQQAQNKVKKWNCELKIDTNELVPYNTRKKDLKVEVYRSMKEKRP